MGLIFDFLNSDSKKKEDEEFNRLCKDLGMTPDEIEDAKKSGISPEEWLEENEPEDYHDQELDQE